MGTKALDINFTMTHRALMTKKIISHSDQFKSGVRVLKLVSRNKDNAERASNRVMISTSESEFNSCLIELYEYMRKGQRIYASVDERDPRKAVRLFKQRQLDNDYNPDVYSFYHNAKNVWASCLDDPTCGFTKFFLFDLDTVDEQTAFWEFMNSEVVKIHCIEKYTTKSGGIHMITNPFNHTLLPTIVAETRKTNAAMLWAYDAS